MLGIGKHVFFSSPQGQQGSVRVNQQGDTPITLRQCINQWAEERNGFRHTLEQYHFSINGAEVSNMDESLHFTNGDTVVATLAKIGGSC